MEIKFLKRTIIQMQETANTEASFRSGTERSLPQFSHLPVDNSENEVDPLIEERSSFITSL